MAIKGMNAELKKVLDRVKGARSQIQNLIQDKAWVVEAKKYAEKQGKEVKRLIDTDVALLKKFLEKEKTELEKIQKQIPEEVAKIKKFVASQKQELQTLLTSVKAKAGTKAGKAAHKAKRQAGVAKKKAGKIVRKVGTEVVSRASKLKQKGAKSASRGTPETAASAGSQAS